jgi:serine/threonine protein kinase
MSKNKSNILLNDYIIVEQIGAGSFGEVYLAQHCAGKQVAIKIEEKLRIPRVYNEYKIYKYLAKSDFKVGLPKIYEFIKTPDYNIMVMQLLGPSLEDLLIKSGRKFNLPTIFLLAKQLISLLQNLHTSGYIHRDIKPNNFLIGNGNNSNQVYMMDFGLSKQYIHNGNHIEFKNKRSLIGTARYASINMHMGIEPTRRDELESVGYMLIYFLKGSLPWQGIKRQKDIDHLKLIGDKKMCVPLDTLCEGAPVSFKKYLKYCRNLKFEETPDYKYMLNLFETDCKNLNIKPKFNWNLENNK